MRFNSLQWKAIDKPAETMNPVDNAQRQFAQTERLILANEPLAAQTTLVERPGRASRSPQAVRYRCLAIGLGRYYHKTASKEL
jgi:hypothetical protein